MEAVEGDRTRMRAGATNRRREGGGGDSPSKALCPFGVVRANAAINAEESSLPGAVLLTE